MWECATGSSRTPGISPCCGRFAAVKAQVRFFSLVMPNDTFGFDYLEAIHQTGLGVKGCPIGPAFLMSPPWAALMHLFMKGELADVYVNVVCCPPNIMMGQALRPTEMKPPPGMGPPISTSDRAKTEEYVYRPQTAFSGLYTIGVANIAITTLRPKPPDPNEVIALSKYDAVLTASEFDAEALKAVGILTYCAPPRPDGLQPILRALLP